VGLCSRQTSHTRPSTTDAASGGIDLNVAVRLEQAFPVVLQAQRHRQATTARDDAANQRPRQHRKDDQTTPGSRPNTNEEAAARCKAIRTK
jgi:hypothetical protein